MPTGEGGEVGKKPICCSPLMDVPGKFTRAEDLHKNLFKWWLRWTKIKLDLFKPWTKSSQLPQSPPVKDLLIPISKLSSLGSKYFCHPRDRDPLPPMSHVCGREFFYEHWLRLFTKDDFITFINQTHLHQLIRISDRLSAIRSYVAKITRNHLSPWYRFFLWKTIALIVRV